MPEQLGLKEFVTILVGYSEEMTATQARIAAESARLTTIIAELDTLVKDNRGLFAANPVFLKLLQVATANT